MVKISLVLIEENLVVLIMNLPIRSLNLITYIHNH